ncbi:hypothetical protein CPC08DRAFT_762341 [Agrocybe pediades]|nr:hypothetical protein CPC08DRAFT_762341 [Agrocybe pediades]
MLFQFIKERLAEVFETAIDLFNARVGANANTSRDSGDRGVVPLAILIRRYGLFKTAIIAAAMEAMACFFLVSGVQRSVERTFPVLVSRAYAVFHVVVYGYVLEWLSVQGRKALAYLDRTTVGRLAMQCKDPAYSLIRVADKTLRMVFGERHAQCQNRRLLVRKVYRGCKRHIIRFQATKYPPFAFVCRVAFKLVAITLFGASIIFAFLFIYAIDLDSVPVEIDEVYSQGFIEEVEEDDGTSSSNMGNESTLCGNEERGKEGDGQGAKGA